MTPSDETKLDRVLDMLARMDERWKLSTQRLADHEDRLRKIEERPAGIRWRDIGAIVGSMSGVAIVLSVVLGAGGGH